MLGDLGGAQRLAAQHLLVAHHALAAQVLGKARALADGVVDGVFLDEGTAALLDPDQAALLQLAHGAPYRVAVDRELGGQLGFGGQLLSGRIEFVADVVRKGFADLPPDGDA